MRTFVRERFLIPSPLSHLRVTTAPLRSGTTFLSLSPNGIANLARYLNGSILIATLKPAFTILHTLTTSRAPSRITGLAWHGTSSKQKSDMLATQTADGDLRVWSVPKSPQHETPTIIRALSRSDIRQPGPSWFAWSKNGRLVQYYDGSVSVESLHLPIQC
jgi:WD40 repeat protein